jgi:hypothetical protein
VRIRRRVVANLLLAHVFADHGRGLHALLVPPLQLLLGLIRGRHVGSKLGGIDEDGVEITRLVLNADNDVNAVSLRFGFEIIVADGEEVYYWLGSRLDPLPRLIEVDDLARVALLPETSQGDLDTLRRDILLVSIRFSL